MQAVKEMREAMRNWDGRTPPDPWPVLRYRLRSNDDPPTTAELLAAMRTAGVPKDLGNLVADRIEEKRRRGRPKDTAERRRRKEARALELAHRVRWRHAVLRILKVRAPRETAIRMIAEEEFMSPRTVVNVLNGLSRLAKEGIPSLQVAVARLKELRRQGLVELTPEGHRWLPAHRAETPGPQ